MECDVGHFPCADHVYQLMQRHIGALIHGMMISGRGAYEGTSVFVHKESLIVQLKYESKMLEQRAIERKPFYSMRVADVLFW